MLLPNRSGSTPFHPLVERWFLAKYSRPTEIQQKAWELISNEESALISAATGSGKTMAAFLWALNQLVSGMWLPGQTRVLYVSPLKALNNDIRRNLLEPLTELRSLFEQEGLEWPDVRVQTRSGDTSQSDRRKLLRRPPEILVTTPESLNLMLTSRDGQEALKGVKSLILDEVHSLVGSKRGVYLMTGVERLALLSGEFQRIALSATVKPMQVVADFVGGYRHADGGFKGQVIQRDVRLAESAVGKTYEITVRYPENARGEDEEDEFWNPIVDEIRKLVDANRSTLIFVNSRRLCEKIAYLVNRDTAVPVAYSHHGSLSREIRMAVEERLKNGDLKAIVATSSLEMGIDIGTLDCVVLVQSPGVVSSGIQRVGRSGHQVGATSQASLFPSHARNFLEAAVLSKAIRERDIEPLSPIMAPLDVLSQVIVSMVGARAWDIDTLYSFMRTVYSYRDLSREHYDLVVNMLAGQYEKSRLRELKPRVSVNRFENTLTIRKGALLAYYFSGGVIADRGYFSLRLESTGARLGELDEEFVWERSVGDSFALGAQSWKIQRITYNEVFVVPGTGSGPMPPFWRSDEFDRDFHYSNRIGEFLEWAEPRIGEASFREDLKASYCLESDAAENLIAFLRKQKMAASGKLPHRHCVIAELVEQGPGGAPGRQLVLHTHWGGRVNRPYSLALDAAWEGAFGHRTEVYANNDCVAIMVPERVAVQDVLNLVDSSTLDIWLKGKLEGSGFFGARFREASSTALLVTRQKPQQRLPLWLSRMRCKKLLESVSGFDDFPILLEAWRSCLQDAFDIDSLKKVLGEIETGEIKVVLSSSAVASPFAQSVAWRQINDKYMYATDDPPSDRRSALREDLIAAVSMEARLRPQIDPAVADKFALKRQRLESGYAPSDPLEFKEWLRDRVALPRSEWEQLLAATKELVDAETSIDDWVTLAQARQSGIDYFFLEESRDSYDRLFGIDPDVDLLVEWLSFYGPMSLNRLNGHFGKSRVAISRILDSLVQEGRVVVGALLLGSGDEHVCERENFETLLRMQRNRKRSSFEPLPVRFLSLYLASQQGVNGGCGGEEALHAFLDQFCGFGSHVECWEELIIPARIDSYQQAWLDRCLVENDIVWRGVGLGRLCFEYEHEHALFSDMASDELTESESRLYEYLTTRLGSRFQYKGLANAVEMSPAELESCLWSLSWKGKISNDSFSALRKGVRSHFKIHGNRDESATRAVPRNKGLSPRRRGRLALRRSMREAGVGYPGNWFALPEERESIDYIETLELQKERARLVLSRYGVVFREILDREIEPLKWRNLFKALRIMELSGEVVAGCFFEGIAGLQFASHEGLRRLKSGFDESSVYWISAVDPASVCGLGLEGLGGSLPMRVASNLLVYRGTEVVLEIGRKGKSLRFHVEVEDRDMDRILEGVKHLLRAAGSIGSRVLVEEINGVDARTSPYLLVLESIFRMHADHKRLILESVS